jgi:hypothetical protein
MSGRDVSSRARGVLFCERRRVARGGGLFASLIALLGIGLMGSDGVWGFSGHSFSLHSGYSILVYTLLSIGK